MLPLTPAGPAALNDVRGRVAIIGIGESIHSVGSGLTIHDMAFEAVDAALSESGLSADQIDGLMVMGGFGGQLTPDIFRSHYGVDTDIWFCERGGAMTLAATAPYNAAEAIKEGRARTILNVFAVDWASQSKAGTGGPASYHREDQVKANAELPFGFIPQPVYFAAMARRHMHEHGTTGAQLGAIAVQLRRHANSHPDAVMRKKLLMLDDYLARPMLVDPLRMEDCCLISDGAGAFIMVASERASEFPFPPVIVDGVGHAFSEAGSYFALEPDFLASPQRWSAPAAFAMAGIRPADVDVLAIYDPFTIAALIQIEDMGFCPKGEGGRFVEGDRLAFDRSRRQGGLPFNTHGGLLSHAYLLGIAHVVELVRQLRGTAANQVKDARLAVYGGYTGIDAGTLVLRRGDTR